MREKRINGRRIFRYILNLISEIFPRHWKELKEIGSKAIYVRMPASTWCCNQNLRGLIREIFWMDSVHISSNPSSISCPDKIPEFISLFPWLTALMMFSLSNPPPCERSSSLHSDWTYVCVELMSAVDYVGSVHWNQCLGGRNDVPVCVTSNKQPGFWFLHSYYCS